MNTAASQSSFQMLNMFGTPEASGRAAPIPTPSPERSAKLQNWGAWKPNSWQQTGAEPRSHPRLSPPSAPLIPPTHLQPLPRGGRERLGEWGAYLGSTRRRSKEQLRGGSRRRLGEEGLSPHEPRRSGGGSARIGGGGADLKGDCGTAAALRSEPGPEWFCAGAHVCVSASVSACLCASRRGSRARRG